MLWYIGTCDPVRGQTYPDHPDTEETVAGHGKHAQNVDGHLVSRVNFLSKEVVEKSKLVSTNIAHGCRLTPENASFHRPMGGSPPFVPLRCTEEKT